MLKFCVNVKLVSLILNFENCLFQFCRRLKGANSLYEYKFFNKRKHQNMLSFIYNIKRSIIC